MTKMRAKVYVESVTRTGYGEKLKFNAVCKKGGYGADGLDENNTYAVASPSASFEIHVANKALWGKFDPGKEYYVDFTPVPEPEPVEKPADAAAPAV